MRVKVLVLAGEGINCEKETAAAFNQVLSKADIVTIRDLLKNPKMLQNYQILVLPGGFSYADEIHSGHILALQLQTIWTEYIQAFLDKKGLILGVCNGFQVLVKLGVFDLNKQNRKLSLIKNDHKNFINKWIRCTAHPSKSIWLQDLQELNLPIRHGEGNLFIGGNAEEQATYYKYLLKNGQIALTYNENVNGSYQNIAGLCDSTGQILGLMPHPEAAMDENLYPSGFEQKIGLINKIFINAINFAMSHQKGQIGVQYETDHSISSTECL